MGAIEETRHPCAVCPHKTRDTAAGEIRMRTMRLRDKRVVAVVRKISTRQRHLVGPGRPPGGQMAFELIERQLGEAPIGRDLAAEYREQGGLTGWGVEIQHVIAGRFLRPRRAVVIERADARIGRDNVGRRHRLAEILAYRCTQIGDLLWAGGGLAGITEVVTIRGADEGKVVLVRDGEDDAGVGTLEDVAAVVIEQTRHDDVAALDEADGSGCVVARDPAAHGPGPGASGVDYGLGGDLPAAGASAIDGELPSIVDTYRVRNTRAGVDGSAAIGGVTRVEHDKARVLDPAI